MKPSNIMVTPDDHAKVLDLGLALIEGEVVDDPEVVGGKGYIVGSVDYIAPEQTRDPTQINARADLYSLGCMLYFALTGSPPFPTGDSKEKVRAHRHQDPEPIRRRNPAVPEGLSGLVHRLMAKEPSIRPPSAAAARQELLTFSDSPALPEFGNQARWRASNSSRTPTRPPFPIRCRKFFNSTSAGQCADHRDRQRPRSWKSTRRGANRDSCLYLRPSASWP